MGRRAQDSVWTVSFGLISGMMFVIFFYVYHRNFPHFVILSTLAYRLTSRRIFRIQNASGCLPIGV